MGGRVARVVPEPTEEEPWTAEFKSKRDRSLVRFPFSGKDGVGAAVAEARG